MEDLGNTYLNYNDQTGNFGQPGQIQFNNLSLIKEEDFKKSKVIKKNNLIMNPNMGSSIRDNEVVQQIFQGNQIMKMTKYSQGGS